MVEKYFFILSWSLGMLSTDIAIFLLAERNICDFLFYVYCTLCVYVYLNKGWQTVYWHMKKERYKGNVTVGRFIAFIGKNYKIRVIPIEKDESAGSKNK